MAKGASFVVQYRRKREGRTDYKKRLDMLKSRTPRLVVRKTNTRILAQVIGYAEDGDRIMACADSNDLAQYGWKFSGKNVPAGYLTGFLCARRSMDAGVKEAVFDIGLNPSIKGSTIYAALKGAIDAGMQIPVGEKILPDEKRIKGGHIADYASKMDAKSYDKTFSGYVKAAADPKAITKSFDEVKANLQAPLKKPEKKK
jgi:large subunit ribosomal protein L18